MNVPTFVQEKFVDENGYMTKPWQNLFQQLLQVMQQSLSDEGFAIPPQSSSNMTIILPGAMNGTLLFNTSAINGGSPTAPNGQLYVKLADGTFHPVTNT